MITNTMVYKNAQKYNENKIKKLQRTNTYHHTMTTTLFFFIMSWRFCRERPIRAHHHNRDKTTNHRMREHRKGQCQVNLNISEYHSEPTTFTKHADGKFSVLRHLHKCIRTHALTCTCTYKDTFAHMRIYKFLHVHIYVLRKVERNGKS